MGFIIKIESIGRKIINHDFVQGQINPPECERFATSPRRGLQIFDTRVDFPVPVQSCGRIL